MSVDYIKAQLNNFKLETIASKKEVDQFCHESPYLRTKREVQEELARAEKYRAGILKTLSTFGTGDLHRITLLIAHSSYILNTPFLDYSQSESRSFSDCSAKYGRNYLQ